ncbi:MAG: dihydroneopterin aldolase [Rhodospirillaceae bacterium]|nr:dihydroneopterin aldolase [Rhodospirillaceae bacterium]MDE0705110.1 dihydroneopterin aldolase [Rhodospirillaceae bacterium]MXW91404.1 dihydroneopterin aldolase [Rhodospirillaceae bacterium]MYB13185.1 dihydroneopterin aldolase [Rhodospirillaceae bacterium]MYI47515.1 dihydroneopterin aldolase [Rhodospirillaceae bacterium]
MTRTLEVIVPHLAAGSDSPRLADALDGHRHIFVRDLVLTCSIGVYRHERDAPQRVRLNIDLAIADDTAGDTDRLGDTVSYEGIVDRARAIVDARHYNLVETLAEALAAMCLDDPRVRVSRIRVEKLDVFADTGAVGVEIERPRKFRPEK